jgi:hypothetical protein
MNIAIIFINTNNYECLGSDFITLGFEDFIDLIEHFTGLVPDEGAKDHQDDGVPSKKAKSKHTKDTQVRSQSIKTKFTLIVGDTGVGALNA